MDSGEMMKSLKQVEKIDRPREKIIARGAAALGDVELLAVMLGTGTKDCDVLHTAKKVVELLDSCKGAEFPCEALRKIPGIGVAKAAVLAAAWEFVRRRAQNGTRISKPSDVMNVVRYYCDRKQEHLLCLSLNGANEVLQCRVITVGLTDRSLVHPREVFADAITDRASGIILAHNHPSGQLLPSAEDRKITDRIFKAGELLGITLVDHVIFTTGGYYSFKEHGEL